MSPRNVGPPKLPAAALRGRRPNAARTDAAVPEELAAAQPHRRRQGFPSTPFGTPSGKAVACSCSPPSHSPASHDSPKSAKSSPYDVSLVCRGPSPSGYSWSQHVWFNSPLNSDHPITPYSEVYGVHPRFFNFDRAGNKVSPYLDAGSPTGSPDMQSPSFAGCSGDEHFAQAALAMQANMAMNCAYRQGGAWWSAPPPAAAYLGGMPNMTRTNSMPSLGHMLATPGDFMCGGMGQHQQLVTATGLPRPR